MTGDVLERLTTAGVSVWLDDLTRDRLADGSLAALVRSRRVTGATSDPSMLAKSLCDSPFYAGQLDDLAHRGVRAEQALRLVTTHDIRWACDILRPVHEATGGADGLVSVGIDPPASPTTPGPPSPRPASCGGSPAGPTSWSGSRRPTRA
ncbi:hypothetical protein GCM10020000_19590 [Streptomyces olivoverticillatus]